MTDISPKVIPLRPSSFEGSMEPKLLVDGLIGPGVTVIATPQELISRYVGKNIWEIELTSVERDKIIEELTSHGLEFEEAGSSIQVFHFKDKYLTNLPGRPRPGTLEDVFFKLTGRSLME